MMLKKHQCPQCEYKAAQKAHLQRHKESIHEGLRFPCPHCEYKATLKESLQIHMQSVHEGQKFPCPHCGSTFTLRGNLQKHIKSVQNCLKCLSTTRNTIRVYHLDISPAQIS